MWDRPTPPEPRVRDRERAPPRRRRGVRQIYAAGVAEPVMLPRTVPSGQVRSAGRARRTVATVLAGLVVTGLVVTACANAPVVPPEVPPPPSAAAPNAAPGPTSEPPAVTDPRDLTPFVDDPCALLTDGEAAVLGLDAPGKVLQDEPPVTVCEWRGTDPPFTLTVATNMEPSVLAIWRREGPGRSWFSERRVDGVPFAVRRGLLPEPSPLCQAAIGVDPEHEIVITVTPLTSRELPDVCAIVEGAARDVLAKLLPR